MKDLNLLQKIFTFYLFSLFIYWLFLFQTGLTTDFWNYLYSFLFTLIPFIGGIIGLFGSKQWGWIKSSVGGAIFYTSLGLVSWGIGNLIWAYYNFFEHISAPYPSFADIGFALAIPFWMAGIINLSKATGAKFGLKKFKGKALFVLIPIFVITLSYYLLFTIAREGILTTSFDNSLKLFLDLVYPIGDVIILTLALVIFGLSFDYFGGRYKVSLLSILLGFIFMYVADFIFSYTTTVGTFYNGNFGDLVFTIALFLLSFGILGFSIRNKSKTEPI